MYKNLVEILKKRNHKQSIRGLSGNHRKDRLEQITGENRVHAGRSTENVCVNAGVQNGLRFRNGREGGVNDILQTINARLSNRYHGRHT